MKVLPFAALLAIFAVSCTSTKPSSSKESRPEPTLSYARDIAPIMVKHCAPCHFPPDGKKKPYDTYEAVRGDFGQIVYRAGLPQDDPKFMPFKLKKPALTDSAMAVLQAWKAQGFPQ